MKQTAARSPQVTARLITAILRHRHGVSGSGANVPGVGV